MDITEFIGQFRNHPVLFVETGMINLKFAILFIVAITRIGLCSYRIC